MLVGVADVALAVAADEAVRRGAEDLLVGGDPADAVLGPAAAASPGRPTPRPATCPRGGWPKSRVCCSTARRTWSGGVLGVAAGVARQLDVGHRLAGQLLVEQQRQDRVVNTASWSARPGRSRPAGGAAAGPARRISRCLSSRAALVVLGEVAALVAQAAQAVVALEGQRVDPGQVEPDLQVAQVALA